MRTVVFQPIIAELGVGAAEADLHAVLEDGGLIPADLDSPDLCAV